MEEIMSTLYKKAALICAAAAAGTVLCAIPISVERSATSGIVLSIDQAQAALVIRAVQLVLQEPIGAIDVRIGAARQASPANGPKERPVAGLARYRRPPQLAVSDEMELLVQQRGTGRRSFLGTKQPHCSCVRWRNARTGITHHDGA
jgi:hypothetical protein